MERTAAGFIIAIAMLGYLLYAFIKENGFLTRKKLLNSEKAQPGAVVEKIEPVVIGSKRNKHYEVQVTFSDGTSYRDKANIMTTGYMKYTIQLDQEKVKPIIEAAIAAHEKAVR